MRSPLEDKNGWTDLGLLFLVIFFMIIPFLFSILNASIPTEIDISHGVELSLIGSAGLITLILPIWGALSNWRYHYRVLHITGEQFVLLQDTIINKYVIDKRGRTKRGDTINDDLWVISKGQKELDITILFRKIQRKSSNNKIWVAITIGPCTKFNNDLVLELKSIVENIDQRSTNPIISTN
jgi:hypothetical protein